MFCGSLESGIWVRDDVIPLNGHHRLQYTGYRGIWDPPIQFVVIIITNNHCIADSTLYRLYSLYRVPSASDFPCQLFLWTIIGVKLWGRFVPDLKHRRMFRAALLSLFRKVRYLVERPHRSPLTSRALSTRFNQTGTRVLPSSSASPGTHPPPVAAPAHPIS